MPAADPPGEGSRCNDRILYDDDRPLICSNPSSYASSNRSYSSRTTSSRSDSSSLLTRHTKHPDIPQPQRMVDNMLSRQAETFRREAHAMPSYHRTLTRDAADFDENYSDPVESVAGGYSMHSHSLPPASASRDRHQHKPSPQYHAARPSSRRKPGRRDGPESSGSRSKSRGRSVREDLRLVNYNNYAEADQPPRGERSVDNRLVEWTRSGSQRSNSLSRSGNTERLTLTDDDDDDDEDEDNCQEHYRRLPPPKQSRPQSSPELQAEHRLVLSRAKEEPDRGEQQLVVRGRDPEERRVVKKSSVEVVATIKEQLARPLADPTCEKYSGYQHCFITIKDEHRFLMLYTFLKRNLDAKVIIFFSTTKSTRYYARLLHQLKFNARAIHHGQSKERYLEDFLEFSQHSTHMRGGSILCVPDSQGGDLAIPPSVEWIVQFEPCSDPAEYIFRVGRISSENSRAVCRALLFLTPDQYGFLKYYQAAKVKFYEYEIPKIAKVQKEMIKLIHRDHKLRRMGTEAYHAYLMAYASHDYRDIYNVHSLDQHKVALCFGFNKPPSKDDEEKEPVQESNDSRYSSKKAWEKPKPRWEPEKKKKETKSWMRGEKSWKYSGIHAEKMKTGGGERDADDMTPHMVRIPR